MRIHVGPGVETSFESTGIRIVRTTQFARHTPMRPLLACWVAGSRSLHPPVVGMRQGGSRNLS